MWCRFTTLTTTLMLHQSTHNTAPHINLILSIAYFIAHSCKKSANYLYVLAPCFWAKYLIEKYFKRALGDSSQRLRNYSQSLGECSPALGGGSRELWDGSQRLCDGSQELGGASLVFWDGSPKLRDEYLGLFYVHLRVRY